MSLEWSLDSLRSAVVPIRHGNKSGSAFFIGPTTLLTARHLLPDAFVGMTLRLSQGDRHFTVMVGDLPENIDVAMLTTTEPSTSWLTLDMKPNVGDRLISYGFPHNYPHGDSFTAEVEGLSSPDGDTVLLKFKQG